MMRTSPPIRTAGDSSKLGSGCIEICQCARCRAGAEPAFGMNSRQQVRAKRLLREHCSATCQRRRRPGQARHRQGRLQITAVTRGLGIKIKWPCTGADGGVLRACGSPSMSPVSPARGASPPFGRGYRCRTATRRLIAMDRRAAVAVGLPRILPVDAAPLRGQVAGVSAPGVCCWGSVPGRDTGSPRCQDVRPGCRIVSTEPLPRTRAAGPRCCGQGEWVIWRRLLRSRRSRCLPAAGAREQPRVIGRESVGSASRPGFPDLD
jgi:hypothetical protein